MTFRTVAGWRLAFSVFYFAALGLLRHEAQIVISVGKLRGVPNPVGPEDPESGPDAPVITYSYYVTYEFAKGEDREKAKVFGFFATATLTLSDP